MKKHRELFEQPASPFYPPYTFRSPNNMAQDGEESEKNTYLQMILELLAQGDPMQPFKNRREAGRQLARSLDAYKKRDDLLILGLPRGGVPVAFEVARRLEAPLDVFVVRKLGVPGQPEVAMGAIASGGSFVLNRSIMNSLNIDEMEVSQVASRERQEMRRREEAYRGRLPEPDIKDKTVILVDDGLATGATMRAAVMAARSRLPAKIVVAVPVASKESCRQLEKLADEVVCLHTPQDFRAVGQWYVDFTQTEDREVKECLDAARADSGTV